MVTVTLAEKAKSTPDATFVVAFVLIDCPCDYVAPSLLAKSENMQGRMREVPRGGKQWH